MDYIDQSALLVNEFLIKRLAKPKLLCSLSPAISCSTLRLPPWLAANAGLGNVFSFALHKLPMQRRPGQLFPLKMQRLNYVIRVCVYLRFFRSQPKEFDFNSGQVAISRAESVPSTRPRELSSYVFINLLEMLRSQSVFCDYLCCYHDTQSNICRRTRYMCWIEIQIRLHTKLSGCDALCHVYSLFFLALV